VDAALARGHGVTLFNRGRQHTHLFPQLEKLRGDRDGDLSALRGRRFDAVIDVSGYTAAQVSASAAAVDAAHYLFISSISAYRSYPPGVSYDEGTPLREGDEGYNAQKGRAEEALVAALGERLTRVRPGLIVGPHDPTERFAYWPRRVARGGDVLAPGRPERLVSFIDARDLAAFCARLIEGRTLGAFNAAIPPVTMEHLLDECRRVAGSDARFQWVPDATLLSAGVTRWTEMPLWIPDDDPYVGGMMLTDSRRAVAAGLTCRPLADTIRDTLAWDRAEGPQPTERRIRATPITAEREARLLRR
jgi:2'-hydroxyisoflavone reductase